MLAVVSAHDSHIDCKQVLMMMKMMMAWWVVAAGTAQHEQHIS